MTPVQRRQLNAAMQQDEPEQGSNTQSNSQSENGTDLSSEDQELASILRNRFDDPSTNETVTRTINVPGVGEVHKSTLISLLNSSNGQLSKDRLKRVQSLQLEKEKKQDNDVDVETKKEVGLFSDVAVSVKYRNGGIVYEIGRVERMRKPGNRGFVEYKRPISLEDQNCANVLLYMSMYTMENGKYVYVATSKKEVPASAAIIGVKMQYDATKRTYSLDDSDAEELKSFIEDHNNNRKSAPKKRKTLRDQQMPDEGRRVASIVPNNDNTQEVGVRRSDRARRHVTYESY